MRASGAACPGGSFLFFFSFLFFSLALMLLISSGSATFFSCLLSVDDSD